MNTLFVAWQNEESREWVPVARLDRLPDHFELTYTRGGRRCPGFVGFGRMSDREKVYSSRTLFPFFQNRLLNKSRPEYRDFLRWLDLDTFPDDPFAELAVTGGIRATDALEIISAFVQTSNTLTLRFFSRGLRHLPPSVLVYIAGLERGADLCLMRDIQNPVDPFALALRTHDAMTIVGYTPRYHGRTLAGVLDADPKALTVKVVKSNPDAPLDMRLLCDLTCPTAHADHLKLPDDFLPWSSSDIASNYFKELGTSLDLSAG